MLTDKNTILITSALPYINGVKHLGNLIGSMLPADFYARVNRLSGKDVLFICATDEHGTPAELAAAEQGLSPAEFCAQAHVMQKELGERFGLSWDYFGRSSSEQNHELTQYFHDKLSENNLIEERETEQVYAIDDQRFLPDRYVIGTCPHCGYDRARGDQCESCTRVLDPADLINPRSAVSGSENIEIRASKHLFLRQSQCVDALRAFIDQKEKEGWPHLTVSIARKWLDEGLKDRGITRDLKWGVPVNRPGFENKVFYVWFDAPIAYIAATKELADETGKGDAFWQSFWREKQGADKVFYAQFMAKDNIPFHTISFPATLIGADEDWKCADYIKGFHWLTYYGGKFSTSQKRGIFMNDAIDLYPSDYWRWYLLSNAPENSDSAFTWEDFQTAVNKDLADVLGNFINRITRFTASKFGPDIPGKSEDYSPVEDKAQKEIVEKIKAYLEHTRSLNIRKAANELRALWVAGNEYLQIAAPWTAFKTDPTVAAKSVRFAFHLIGLFGALCKPFIPDTAEKIGNVLPDVNFDTVWQADEKLETLFSLIPENYSFSQPEVLFNKIEDETIEALKLRFGGI